jgi:tetratricopeptide (TPR) repeat protein
VEQLGRPQDLARAVRVREQAAHHLGDWSHAHYLAQAAQIDRLLQRGGLPAAQAAAHHLHAKSLAAGESAYPGAAYDIADAHFLLGRVLQMSGAAEAALAPLAEARHRYQQLAATGDTNAEHMVSVTFTETGDCLVDLGRLDSAAQAYEERIRRASSLGDVRGAAVAKGQLATVRLRQRRYEAALDSYTQARDTFEKLGEPQSVATAWHQIGRVHEETGHVEASEQAYRQSLAIRVRENDLPGQAATLNQLGNLYHRMGRMEEAATFYKQSAENSVRSGDLAGEGRSRHNLARTLIRLHRYDDARQELQRAIECKEPYGHAAEPWMTWANLEELERATGHAQEAHTARHRAIETYLAYRHAGGESQSPQHQLFTQVAQAIRQNTHNELAQQLTDHLKPDNPPWYTALIQQLHSILTGHRDPTTTNHEVHYMHAAELQLLLETLSQHKPGKTQK